MMSQRFSLFYAGFTSYAPALYFSQLDFIDRCDCNGKTELKNTVSRLSKITQDKVDEYNSHLKTANSIAKHFDLEVRAEPTSHEEFFNWLNLYVAAVENEFPMSRIDHYYFLYARKIAEIVCNNGMIKMYLEVTRDGKKQIDLSQKIDKCLKDIEYTLFKLMAAAALLSSEPRQNYFNLYYRSLCTEFDLIKDVDITNLQDQQLNKLEAGIKDYDLLVMDGFKKCIGMLKELGI